mgnify:CR=1 FL=1
MPHKQLYNVDLAIFEAPVWIKLSHLQNKVAFMKVKQALIPHFAKFHGQSAALHAEIIRKLLTRERNVELIAVPAL